MPLHNVRIVLVHPTHPGNVGATARAMKTMDLDQLYLVAPAADTLAPEARARAAGALDVLERAVTCDSLFNAIDGCRVVIGTSSRARSIPWPALDARACAMRLVSEAKSGLVALVFGREKMGLTNAELDLCEQVVNIPSNPAYASLNLACAVQVMSYEIFRASRGQREVERIDWHEPRVALARSEDIERFYRHLEQVLVQIGYLDPKNPRKLMRRLYRLFNRVALDENELNILRGIVATVQKHDPQDQE
ncbi:MAG: RNA methyltransferase [Acidiferrobacterales bacterium]